jgi:hypothetical protein
MAESEVPVSDKVLDDDGDGDVDGEDTSEEGGEPGLKDTTHKKTN